MKAGAAAGPGGVQSASAGGTPPPLGSPSRSGAGAADGAAGSGSERGREEEQRGQHSDEDDDGEDAQLQEKFDTQCALCDDGGKLLACDGPCMRSFHTDPDGCNLLLLPPDLAEFLSNSNETFLCPNCLAGEHQCHICKQKGKAEVDVFKCINASCGRYYHPECVGEEKGQPFVCPLHTCAACGGYAAGATKDGELVPCRRCPLAYHRRCLPADLPRNRDRPQGARVWLADQHVDEEGEVTWLDGVEQSLCYCRRHRLDADTEQAVFEVGPEGRLYDPGWQEPYLLVDRGLLKRFRLHYARGYRHLPSSRRLLELMAEKAAKAKKAAAAKAQAKRSQAAAAAPAAGLESEEDEPLQAKRRRLFKAGSIGARVKQAAVAAAEAALAGLARKAGPAAAASQQAQRAQQAGVASGKAAAAAVAAAPPTAAAAAVAAAPPPAAAAAQPEKGQRQAAAGAAEQAAAQEQQQAMSATSSEAAASTEDAGETEDAADAGGLVGMEAGEEVLQPVLAGGRPGVAALPAATDGAQGRAELQQVQSPRRRLQDALEQLVKVPSRSQRRERLQRLLQEAEDDEGFTKDALWKATRRPEPYRHAMKKTIDEGKLANFERAVRHALSGRVPAHQLLDRAAVQSIVSHYDDLFMVLAPYLHGERYSSYGRHFTSQALLHRVADRLAMFLRSGDQVVDFSCGENHFVPYLKERCLSLGVAITGRSYDIILAKDATDFVLKSWFDTRPDAERLEPKERLCVCLNPPFGKNNTLANKFVEHAARWFAPRLIALIVPPGTVIPREYDVVYENAKMCGGEEFYVPGSTHRSWNKEWPVLRVLMRRECSPALAHLGEPTEFEEVMDCTAHVAAEAQQAGLYHPQQALPLQQYGHPHDPALHGGMPSLPPYGVPPGW